MKVLFLGLFIFSLSFLFHLIIWKTHLPKKQVKALLQIFFITLILYLVVLSLFSPFLISLSLFTPGSFTEYLHLILFFISLTLAYIVTYSAIEVDSPSLVIVMAIAKSGLYGLNKENLEALMTDDVLVKPRIKDLLNSKMIYLDANNYKLTKSGYLFIRPFIFYRRLLKAGKGG